MVSRCSTQREQHYQRHKEVASVVQKLQRFDDVVIWSNSPLPRKKKWSRASSDSNIVDDEVDVDDCEYSDDEWAESSTTEWTEYDARDDGDPESRTRREKKAARKATRDKARFAGLTKGDINRVQEVLYGSSQGVDGNSDSADPLESSTIEDNIAFNPSTFKYSSLRTQVHKKKLLKNNVSPKNVDRERRQGQDAEITILIQRLGIDSVDVYSGPKERRSLLVKLREAIRNDLECVANEEQQRMMRMAGYWRYANRRTYNHMVQKNQIWDWETGAKLEVIDEGEEASEEDASCRPSPLSEGNLQHIEPPAEAFTELAISAPTQPTPLARKQATGKNLEDFLHQDTIAEALSGNIQSPSPYEGKADDRHLQNLEFVAASPTKLDMPKQTEDNTESHKENLSSDAAEVKLKDDEEGTDSRSPLKPRVIRIDVKGHSKPKPGLDPNNRFSLLTRFQETDLRSAPVRPLEIAPESTSRRSSVRRAANPRKSTKALSPSPLRTMTATSSRAQGISKSKSAFPELPGTKAVKPKIKAPHPPARLTPEKALDFSAQQLRRGAVPMNYAAVLRRKLEGS